LGASVVITTSDYPHSSPTPCTGSRFLPSVAWRGGVDCGGGSDLVPRGRRIFL